MKRDKYKDGFELLHQDEFEDGGDRARVSPLIPLDPLISSLTTSDVPVVGTWDEEEEEEDG